MKLNFQRLLFEKYCSQKYSLKNGPRNLIKVSEKLYFSLIEPDLRKLWVGNFQKCSFFWKFRMWNWTFNGSYSRNIARKNTVWISGLEIWTKFQKNFTSASLNQIQESYDWETFKNVQFFRNFFEIFENLECETGLSMAPIREILLAKIQFEFPAYKFEQSFRKTLLQLNWTRSKKVMIGKLSKMFIFFENFEQLECETELSNASIREILLAEIQFKKRA